MPGGIVVPRFGFHTHVQTVISAEGSDVASATTYDVTGVVGCAAIVDGTGTGLRVSGIHGSSDSWLATVGLRLVICSLAGTAQALASLLESFPGTIGAFWSPGTGNFGMLIPDLTTLQPNTTATGGTPSPGNPNALRIHLDETVNVSGGYNGGASFDFSDAPIEIPPNNAAAAIIIGMRLYSGNPISGTNQLGWTVRGALVGRGVTAREFEQQQGNFLTPARFGNVGVPGPLAGS